MSNQYTRGSEWRRWDLHVHTASSYDAGYKGDDSDKLLCDALGESGVAAVAITDHFLIDHERITRLRELAPNITFFPGVELRTDKGSQNLHLILIFSEKMNIKTLSDDFDAIMIRQKARASGSNETIYWTFDDIISFATDKKALVSIHAGKKTNGIDREITNALPVNEAIKEDIASHIDFFEVGKYRDIADYYEHVFKDVDEKPIIMCSDCHDPRDYSVKEKLWIKANPSFEGLLQCIYQPKERVFVGTIPPALDRERKNGRSNIAKIIAKRVPKPKNTIYNWLDFDLDLSSGMVAIIGNKGSGKSALSDILGHLCKCTTMPSASFLSANRFRKAPKNYADDYEATIIWGDLHQESSTLAECNYETTIENAQYLPQKYIEDVCSEIDNTFQDEIDKVIFSYVDKTERGSAKNLGELVINKSRTIEASISKVQRELEDINARLIRLEDRKTKQYRTYVEDSLKKLKETLGRHIKVQPREIAKPGPKDDDREYQTQINSIDQEISNIEKEIADKKAKLTITNENIDDTEQLIASIEALEVDVREINIKIQKFIEKHLMDAVKVISLGTPKESLNEFLIKLRRDKYELQALLYGSSDKAQGATLAPGLFDRLSAANDKKSDLVSTADGEEKAYQKYLLDYKEWENEKKRIEGDVLTEDTIAYFEAELLYLNEKLKPDYGNLCKTREEKITELYYTKHKLVDIYKNIYSPVELEIGKILGDLEESISFVAEIQLLNNDLADSLLGYINKNYGGVFKGKAESLNKMNQLIRETEFNRVESILQFINNVMQAVYEDVDISSKKIIDKQAFYNILCSLDYIGVAFKLKVGGRDLDELSPGERGIVLLAFYLALSKNSSPIIIDQPEDNLDNQSVYSKLVPCICEAKKKRQVIIVTHNPNIAIACDAEQIILCEIDKTSNSITYKAGTIEDPHIKQHVVDVLEGTMPAFDLRKRKYFEYE